MMVQGRRLTVDYQHWYIVGKQLAQLYSDCGKNNFPTMEVQGLFTVYTVTVVHSKIPAFVQCWVTAGPIFFRLWKK